MSSNYTNMSFREIARAYNDINRIPPEAAQALGKKVASLVGNGSTVLDVGAGAGRIALPVAASGVKLTALDSEAEMLDEAARLAAEQHLTATFIKGDAVHLPFEPDSFDAVMTSNVLHLVSEWQNSLKEMQRVLRTGGLLIQGRDWLDPNSCAGKIRNQMRRIIGTLNPAMQPTAAAGPAMFQTLAQMGGTTDPEIVAATWHEKTSPAQVLSRMAARTNNETWQLEESLFNESMNQITAWTKANFENLDAEETVEWRFMLYVTRGLKANSKPSNTMKAIILYDSLSVGGSTDKLIDSFGLRLAELGATVEKARTIPHADYSFVEEFDTVIIGSPIYNFMLAKNLVDTFKESNLLAHLKGKNVATFIICGGPEVIAPLLYESQLQYQLTGQHIVAGEIFGMSKKDDPTAPVKFAETIFEKATVPAK
jgi:predicted O-methyltransferase YrrM